MKRKELSVGLEVAVTRGDRYSPEKAVVLSTDRWIKKPYYLVTSRDKHEPFQHHGRSYDVESTSRPAGKYDTNKNGVLLGYDMGFGGYRARTTPLGQIMGEWEPVITEWNEKQARIKQARQERQDRHAAARTEIRAALEAMGIDPDDPGVSIKSDGTAVTLSRRLLP